MNRYKSSSKIKAESSSTIIFEEEFQQPKQQHPNINNLRYKSIPSKAAFVFGDQILLQQDSDFKLKLKPLDQLKMVSNDSSEIIKMNNFFGSKNTLQRKAQLPIEQKITSQNKTQRILNDEQDPNQKLARLVQKQIEDREKWQKMAQIKQRNLHQNSLQSINEQTSNDQVSQLLVINNPQSMKKASSKQKLQKITTQKFSALNLQKNNLFENKAEQQDYQQPKTIIEHKKQEQIQSVQKKKRSVTQLRPLKKKLSTYEVLNQLDMGKKKDATNIGTNPSKKSMLKKRLTAKEIQNFQAFNKQELGRGMYIEGIFERNSSGICNSLWPEFRMIFDNQNIIYCKKTTKGYDIMLDPSHPEFLSTKKLGTVHGNFIGSYWNIFQGQEQKQILATIYYNPDSKCVTRQVELYVKRSDLKYQDCDRDDQNDKTVFQLKSLYLQGDNRCDGKIRKFVSKQPYFDERTKSYKLDFGGKATMLSVKNVILVDAQNTRQKIFVFGKCGHNTFNFKAEHPLSPLVIMGYLMSSFNFKFATE